MLSIQETGPKTVLLTGAAGFIGAHTVDHLLDATDWNIVALDSLRHKGRLQRLFQVATSHTDFSRVEFVQHDLNEPIEVDYGADYIINMASESHVDRSIENPVPFIQNNVMSTTNMLEYARKHPPEKFIQVSTDEVYGPMHDKPHPEWDVAIPSNPYSASKAAQESIAIAYWRTYGVPLMITNTMNNYGEMQDVEKFIPNTIGKILTGKVVDIHGVEGDIGSRFYLHARNHADALVHLLRNVAPPQFPSSQRPSRFNVVGDEQVDNLEMAQKIGEIIGKEFQFRLVDFHSTRPGHDPHYGLDGSLLKSTGWEPPVPFEESLKQTVEWTVQHPEWLKET